MTKWTVSKAASWDSLTVYLRRLDLYEGILTIIADFWTYRFESKPFDGGKES